MSEIKFVELKCQRCGGEIKEEHNGVYSCQSCGGKWQKQTFYDFADMLESCEQALRNQRIKLVANQRRQYTEELSGDESKGEYASFIRIAECCTEIRKYIPEDFYANFFLAAVSERRGALDKFLKKVNLTERGGDISYMLDFLIKYMKGLWLDAVGDFIERVKNAGYLELYSKYRGEYEKKQAILITACTIPIFRATCL